VQDRDIDDGRAAKLVRARKMLDQVGALRDHQKSGVLSATSAGRALCERFDRYAYGFDNSTLAHPQYDDGSVAR